MAICLCPSVCGAPASHRCSNSTEAFFCPFVLSLFFTLTINRKEPRPAPTAAQVLLPALREKQDLGLRGNNNPTLILWLGKQDASHRSCCDTKTLLVAVDNPGAKLLMIENKQLLDATQLVVWHHLCHRLDSRTINRHPAVRLCPFKLGQKLDSRCLINKRKHLESRSLIRASLYFTLTICFICAC